MRTIDDIKSHCLDERETEIEVLLDGLEDTDKFYIGYAKGRIDALGDLADEIHRNLKYHECEFDKNSECFLCYLW